DGPARRRRLSPARERGAQRLDRRYHGQRRQRRHRPRPLLHADGPRVHARGHRRPAAAAVRSLRRDPEPPRDGPPAAGGADAERNREVDQLMRTWMRWRKAACSPALRARPRGRRRLERAYTAVEVLMSLAVLAVGVTGIIATEKVTLTANVHAKNLAIATRIGQ